MNYILFLYRHIVYRYMEQSKLKKDPIKEALDEMNFDYDDWPRSSAQMRFSAIDPYTMNDDVGESEDGEQALVNEGYVSLAYEQLTDIPHNIAYRFAPDCTHLDLSHNNIKNLTFLECFHRIDALVLDKNKCPDANSLPFMPRLKIIWLNYCELTEISKWIEMLAKQCPQLRQLSMIGNPGAKSEATGASRSDNAAYRKEIVKKLPLLEYLDGLTINGDSRRRPRGMGGRMMSAQEGFFRMLNPANMFNAFKTANKQEFASTNADREQ